MGRAYIAEAPPEERTGKLDANVDANVDAKVDARVDVLAPGCDDRAFVSRTRGVAASPPRLRVISCDTGSDRSGAASDVGGAEGPVSRCQCPWAPRARAAASFAFAQE